MQFKFTSRQKQYVKTILAYMINECESTGNRDLRRKTAKLAEQFTENATTSNLNPSECSLIYDISQHLYNSILDSPEKDESLLNEIEDMRNLLQEKTTIRIVA